MSDGTHGFGTVMGRETVTPGTYADIGEPVDVKPPEQTRDTVDVTHHKSANRVRQFIGGLRDAGEAELQLNFNPGATAHDDLMTDYSSDAPHNYKISFPNGNSVTFPALVTRLSPVTPLDGKMTLTARFKLTGAPTWAA